MKNILAATFMIIGAIFISAYAICDVIASSDAGSGDLNEKILLLIGGIIAMLAGIVLFVLEFKKKQNH